jgi:hypothetical protein
MSNRWASFYDASASPYAFEAQRWLRYEREPPLLSRVAVYLVLASLLLLVFVSADVGAYYSLPVKVTITQVHWYIGNFSLGNQSGFAVQGGHDFSRNLVCELFCVRFTGVSVNSPFVLVNDTIAFPWFEYVNMTIRAPNFAYDGPLDLTLSI